MLFNSFEFVFGFLPVALLGYIAAVRSPFPRAGVLWLALASLAFYALWDYRFLAVIGASILLNYCLGIVIAGLPRGGRARLTIFVLAVVMNLAAIAFYKYANLGITTFNALARTRIDALAVTLPLGISFFTFTQIAYLADVHRGYPREAEFGKYVLFVTYFPHLIAGPILHHSEIMPQFATASSRSVSMERFAAGLTCFVIGLFKKTVVADALAMIADPMFQAATKGAVSANDAWGGTLAYSLQIYFDFSGYSDMAVGLSCLFGIVLPFNFDAPYKARSIIEFWRRWHISLSRFLRDYLYIPMGGNRRGQAQQYANLAVTMLIGGLWHGASWTFVAWGGLHAAFLFVNHFWVKLRRRTRLLNRLARARFCGVLALLFTQTCVVIAWVFFRAESFGTAMKVLSAMAGLGPMPPTGFASRVTPVDMALVGVGYVACFCLPNVNTLFAGRNLGISIYDSPRPWTAPRLEWRPSAAWAVFVAALALASLLAMLVVGGGTKFLYFQF